jgi:glycosyltransferase involved in cell wall biosynthesis
MSKTRATAGTIDDVADAVGERISVAVLYPGGREDKVLEPLRASPMEISVEPADPASHDVILLDQPRRNLAKAVFRYGDTPVVYRVRGNLWKEMDIWRFGRSKKLVATNFLYPRLDAAVAVDERLAGIFAEKTGLSKCYTAGLPKDISNWTPATHESRDLQLITLSNFNYRQKINPLKRYVPVVNDFLDRHEGHWRICGEGIHDETFAEFCAEFPHVTFEGYVDPHEYLPSMDAMIHVSEFDAWPNAILEGLASRLPVLTNNFGAFRWDHTPNLLCDEPRDLCLKLKSLQDPDKRRHIGKQGRQYVADDHDPETIGRQWQEVFEQLL